MGTNFYLTRQCEECCETCGKCDRDHELHIGKSSMGWVFALHVIPDEGINDLDDWKREWSRPGVVIRDEYGDTLTPVEMEDWITNRGREKQWPANWWEGPFGGYRSEADFHARNHSERGPNGLLRRRVDGVHCVGHGAGTWDLSAGEFS